MEYHKSQSFKIFQSYIDCLNLGYSYSPQQGYAIEKPTKAREQFHWKKIELLLLWQFLLTTKLN